MFGMLSTNTVNPRPLSAVRQLHAVTLGLELEVQVPLQLQQCDILQKRGGCGQARQDSLA